MKTNILSFNLIAFSFLLMIMASKCDQPKPEPCPDLPDSTQCLRELDSLREKHDNLKLSFIMLVQMYDSVLSYSPTKDIASLLDTIFDTLWIKPQCTLCYESIDSVDGVQYYIGYDGKPYKVYRDNDTILRIVFFKDSTVIRYHYSDSLIPTPPRLSLMRLIARGTICDGEYPRLHIFVDGEFLKTIYVRSSLNNLYAFNILLNEWEIDSVRLTFDNDLVDHETGEDRNLWIQSLKINEFEACSRELVEFRKWAWWDTISDGIYFGSNGSAIFNVNGGNLRGTK